MTLKLLARGHIGMCACMAISLSRAHVSTQLIHSKHFEHARLVFRSGHLGLPTSRAVSSAVNQCMHAQHNPHAIDHKVQIEGEMGKWKCEMVGSHSTVTAVRSIPSKAVMLPGQQLRPVCNQLAEQ